jgi:hypothetical protein
MVAKARNRTSETIPEPLADAIVRIMRGIDDCVDVLGAHPADRALAERAAAEVRSLTYAQTHAMFNALAGLLLDAGMVAGRVGGAA